MKHSLKHFSCALPALLALACAASPAFAITALPSGINGFNDPGGFTLTGNQNAPANGVPTINGGTLHLTTAQNNENTSAYANNQQDIRQFYASFVYHYNGTSQDSLGPGNGFAFVLQNDPRGLMALGTTGFGTGRQDEDGTIMPSAAVEFNLFTGFNQGRGTLLAFNGDPGVGTFRDTTPVNLISGDPISVILSYDGTTLSETLFDTVTRATYTTSYPNTDLPTAAGGAFAYVGFTGGTGGAVADQTITNFVFTNNVPMPPVNTGPKITVTASLRSVTPVGDGTEQVRVDVTTTNTGGAAADILQITSVTLDSVSPLPVPPSSSPVPTTPNNLSNLSGMNTQTNRFVFMHTMGPARASLHVVGHYTDPNTGIISSFTSSIRLLLP